MEILRVKPLTPFEARQKTPLALAFLGDSLWDLLTRRCLLETECKAGALHKQAVARVNAKAQAEALVLIKPHLTPEEGDIVRRGENAQAKHQAPKNQNAMDYHSATGLEALFGYLYLTAQYERMATLFDIACPIS